MAGKLLQGALEVGQKSEVVAVHDLKTYFGRQV